MSAMIGIELTVSNKKYVVETYIGHGSFGDVYRAVHQPTTEYIAVKILPKDYDYESRKALQNEISLAGKVVHPNVVTVLESNLDPNHPLGMYLAMEYVSEGTLKQKLSNWQKSGDFIPLSQAGRIMLDVAQGARSINEFLIHRDIKPDNILFNGSKFKITDFGIAKMAEDSTRDSTFKGIQHPRYMAPENWLGEQNTEKMDVYSVGLVFYEILTYKHPLELFVDNLNSHRDWETAHISKAAPDVRELRADVEPRWAQLLILMSAKRPDSRPTWDEIVKTIDGSEVIRERKFKLGGLIDAAAKSQNNMFDEKAKFAEQKRQVELQKAAVNDAVAQLAKSLDEVIESFNEDFPDGQFNIVQGIYPHAIRQYTKNHLAPYFLYTFDGSFPLQIHETQEFALVAGYVGPVAPSRDNKLAEFMAEFSANLILVQRSAHDMIGEWRFAYYVDSCTVSSKSGSKTIQVYRGKSTRELLFPSPMVILNRQRVGHSRSRLIFRTDIQQAFIDLLEGAIQFADATRPKL